MAKTITRTISFTFIYHVVVEVDKTGDTLTFRQPRAEVMGKLSEKEIVAFLIKKYPHQTPIVTGVEIVGYKYEMSLEDFYEHAHLIGECIDQTDSDEGITDDMYEPVQYDIEK